MTNKIIFKLKNFCLENKHSCVITIGNFDGVHLGHQRLLKQNQQLANSNNLQSIALLIENSKPAQFSKIQSFKTKVAILSKFVDTLVIVPLYEIKAMTAVEFFKLLYSQARCAGFVVGPDFKFGNNRLGDVKLLENLCAQHNIKLAVVGDLLYKGNSVRSSKIRELLATSDILQIKLFLARKYLVSGRVVAGKQLGRQLGAATANIKVKKSLILMLGVFAVKITICGQSFDAVANIGTRPTVSNYDNLVFEVHIFDFAMDIYSKKVTVEFIAKIRDEKKFASKQQLIAAIVNDIETAKNILNEYND